MDFIFNVLGQDLRYHWTFANSTKIHTSYLTKTCMITPSNLLALCTCYIQIYNKQLLSPQRGQGVSGVSQVWTPHRGQWCVTGVKPTKGSEVSGVSQVWNSHRLRGVNGVSQVWSPQRGQGVSGVSQVWNPQRGQGVSGVSQVWNPHRGQGVSGVSQVWNPHRGQGVNGVTQGVSQWNVSSQWSVPGTQLWAKRICHWKHTGW